MTLSPPAKSVTTHKPLQAFRAGLWLGAGLSLVLILTLIGFASLSGVVVLSVERFPALIEWWYWIHENLRSSVVPFLLVLLAFTATLLQLRQRLRVNRTDYTTAYRLDKRSDLLIGLFFGIGVIWTAIGMRSALVGALGGLDAESAARLGAFGVLQAMVEQGILLALSTTIVGGIGGYLMRLTKMLYVGVALDECYAVVNQQSTAQVLAQLAAIEQAVHALQPASHASGSS